MKSATWQSSLFTTLSNIYDGASPKKAVSGYKRLTNFAKKFHGRFLTGNLLKQLGMIFKQCFN